MKITVITDGLGYIIQDAVYLKIEDQQSVHMASDGQGIAITSGSFVDEATPELVELPSE